MASDQAHAFPSKQFVPVTRDMALIGVEPGRAATASGDLPGACRLHGLLSAREDRLNDPDPLLLKVAQQIAKHRRHLWPEQ